MLEEKKEGSCCSSGGCGCGKAVTLLIGLLIGAFIFAAGMWFAKSQGYYGWHNYCPFSAPVVK